MSAASILSERLELVPLSPSFLEALLAGRAEDAGSAAGIAIPAGWPDEHDRRFLELRAAQMREEPAREQWVRAVVLRQPDRPMIGHAGFHGPPGTNGARKPGALELGYTIFEPFRGRGYATEAASALTRWAAKTHGVRHFIASVAPDNVPSLAVVRKVGFVQTGTQWDEEDGEELVFELNVAAYERG